MLSFQLRSWLHCLSFAGLVSSLAISPPAAVKSIEKRTIVQGWSLQSSTCPSGDTSCGNSACCPSSLFCIAAANDEVDACCTTNSACRGSIEGNPVCADSSWSLWKGFQGSENSSYNSSSLTKMLNSLSNGFCCQVGLVGVYNSQNSVAGACVASTATAGYTTAVIVSYITFLCVFGFREMLLSFDCTFRGLNPSVNAGYLDVNGNRLISDICTNNDLYKVNHYNDVQANVNQYRNRSHRKPCFLPLSHRHYHGCSLRTRHQGCDGTWS